MILRIAALVCIIFLSPALGKLDIGKFAEIFEDLCFQNEENEQFKVNGQDRPLSNTLENFIDLAEKLEAANPSITLKDELHYFISGYVFENIIFTNGKADEWKTGRSDLKEIDAMWEPDNISPRPSLTIPFTESENCSLYFMISHSIINKDEQLLRSWVPDNSSFERAYNNDLKQDDFRPQELGVVAIRGTDVAVSLSKVLLGLYVGVKSDRKKDLMSYSRIQGLQDKIPEENLPQDKIVDELYAVTIADVLMQSSWSATTKPGLAPNGKWKSINIDEKNEINGFCPMVYLQESKNGVLPAYSYSSVRGAADGLILGLAESRGKFTTRLSQILRMYYSPEGIPMDSSIEELNGNSKLISFCNRDTLMESLGKKLDDQMLSYGYLIATTWKDVKKGFDEAKSRYNRDKGGILQNSDPELVNYCQRATDIKNPEQLPREIFQDIIVVMDSSNPENFKEQQIIIGNLAKYLDLRYTASRMTILLDQKNTSVSGTSSRIVLNNVVCDTYSSSCAACMVGQLKYEQPTIGRDGMIEAITQFLQERKDNETQYYGVNGKVVIYFNYQNNENIDGNLQKALTNLHLNHKDIRFYAVGLNPEILKKYAREDPFIVLFSKEEKKEDIAKKLFQLVSYAPSLLQFAACDKYGNDEKEITYENLISPYYIQHMFMPAEYMYKSTKQVVFKFESPNGNVKVCHNRATKKPENEDENCQVATANSPVEFKTRNPCKGFTKENCSPFYFSVIGMGSNGEEMKPNTRTRGPCNDLRDKWCRTMDQMSFKVSFKGISCNGCLGLGAPPAVIILSLLTAFYIHKKY